MAKKVASAKEAARRREMSNDHKAALAEGRQQGRAVRRYLEALDQDRTRRGRKRTRESVEHRLASVEERLEAAGPLDRLHLAQERIDLNAQLASMDSNGVDMPALEQAFVAAAADYGGRRGIAYAAWREAGVPASVLRRAGIARSR